MEMPSFDVHFYGFLLLQCTGITPVHTSCLYTLHIATLSQLFVNKLYRNSFADDSTKYIYATGKCRVMPFHEMWQASHPVSQMKH